MILMKQQIPNNSCLPKARRIKQSQAVGVINKLELQKHVGRKSIERLTIKQSPKYVASDKRIFKYSISTIQIFNIVPLFYILI